MRKIMIPVILIQFVFSTIAASNIPEKGMYVSPRYEISDIELIENIKYGEKINLAGKSKILQVDLFIPPNAKISSQPLIIIIHGGGFIQFTKERFRDWAMEYASCGYVAACINYRLTPGEIRDAGADNFLMAATQATEDGMDAIRFLKKNAGTYGIDKDRIATIGMSAGGWISVINAIEPDSFNGVSNTYPGISSRVNAAIATGVSLGDRDPRFRDQLLTYEKDDTPVLLFHAETADKVTSATWEDAMKFAGRINASGNSCEIFKQPGDTHVDKMNPGGNYWNRILPFLWKHLDMESLNRAYMEEGLQIKKDLVYATYGDREMKLDLYKPAGDQFRPATFQQSSTAGIQKPSSGKEPLPGIVLIHGGGWWQFNKEHYANFGAAIAREGFVCVSIDYRLSGEAQFPAAIYDCKAAVRWLRAHAGEYGVDPDRIGCLGGSAGGHLSALMATTSSLKELEGNGGNPDQSSRVQAAVVFEGPVDQYDKFKGKSREDTPSNSLNFYGGTADEKPELYKLASPIRHIDNKTPPVLFINNGENPYLERIPFQKKLDALGINNNYIHFEGGKHGSWNRPPLFEKYVEASVEYFNERLK